MQARTAANQINLALFTIMGTVSAAQSILDNLSTVVKQAALRSVIDGADPVVVATGMVDTVLH